MKLPITTSKYHSGYLCQISLQTMLLPKQIEQCKSITIITAMLHTLMETLLSANQSARTILVIL